MRSNVRGAVLALLAIALVSGRALAEDQQAAKALYKDAILQYNVGEYEKALEKFKAAYLAHPDPAFLFNIAQCQRQLGQYAVASKSYRAFLRESPNLPDRTRDDVQRLITEMDDAARDQRAKSPPTGTQPPQEAGQTTPAPLPDEPRPAAPTTAPAATPALTAAPPPAPRPWYKNPGGLALTGGGVVIAVVGAGLLGKASSDEASARNALTLPAQQSDHDSARTFQNVGIALIAVGAAATAAGVIVLAVASRHRTARVEAHR